MNKESLTLKDPRLYFTNFSFHLYEIAYVLFSEIFADTNNINYMKKNAKEHSFKSLIHELIEAGIEISGEETLRKKIKNWKKLTES